MKKKKFVCLDIYRPPNNNHKEFIYKCNEVVSLIPTNFYAEVFNCGDYDLNLLNYESNAYIQEFVDNMAWCTFLPTILIPTGITETL